MNTTTVVCANAHIHRNSITLHAPATGNSFSTSALAYQISTKLNCPTPHTSANIQHRAWAESGEARLEAPLCTSLILLSKGAIIAHTLTTTRLGHPPPKKGTNQNMDQSCFCQLENKKNQIFLYLLILSSMSRVQKNLQTLAA